MRYEVKYKIDPINLAMVHQAVRQHPGSFKKIFPDRQVNNIYFDTPELTTFKDNVKGVSERKKYRVRWYSDQPAIIESPRFEIKIKQNELGDKLVHNIAAFDFDQLSSLSQEISELSKTGTHLNAVLMNAYKRSYYGTSNGKFRITIDHDLRYFSWMTALKFTKYQIKEHHIILELKYDRDWEEESEMIKQFIPFRRTKSSKYVNGVELTLG